MFLGGVKQAASTGRSCASAAIGMYKRNRAGALLVWEIKQVATAPTPPPRQALSDKASSSVARFGHLNLPTALMGQLPLQQCMLGLCELRPRPPSDAQPHHLS
jgi:hypothetical protein